jgi:hypothetical protein
MVTLLSVGLLWKLGFRNDRKFRSFQQGSNRLIEFFGEEDLTKAKAHYAKLSQIYTPDQAFEIVVAKGGFYAND